MNELIGKKYNKFAFFENDNNEVNCLGLVRLIDKEFDKHISSYLKNEMNRSENLNVFLEKFYDEIDFDLKNKNDIILIKDKDSKSYKHIGIVLDKYYFIHAPNDFVGTCVEPIYSNLFNNKDIKILRIKKEVENESIL